MAELSGDPGDDTGHREPTVGPPRWVKLFALFAVVVVVLVVVMLLAGGNHGPGRHTGGGAGSPPSSSGITDAGAEGGHTQPAGGHTP